MHPGPHVIRKQALLWLSYVIVNDRTGEVNVFTLQEISFAIRFPVWIRTSAPAENQ